jgi:hypothetical protein
LLGFFIDHEDVGSVLVGKVTALLSQKIIFLVVTVLEILMSKMYRLKPCGFMLHILGETGVIQVQIRFVGV